MSYNVFIHPQAIKFLRRTPRKDVERIKAKLQELTEPHAVRAVKLKGKNAFRVRVGDYRILFTIDESKKVVVVVKIDKRSRVYDRI